MMLESTPYPPQVSNLDSRSQAVEISAQQVGVSSTKRRPFVVCVRIHPSTEEHLIRWKARVTSMSVHPVTLGEFVDHKGSYCLNREQGEQIFSFEDPILWLIRGHILGEKPAPSRDINLFVQRLHLVVDPRPHPRRKTSAERRYQPHPSHESSLEDVQELHLADFTRITTGLEGCVFPLTLNRSAIATVLVDSTPAR